MSNSLVGQVYASIIDEVVNSSRVDFEENGVDESALEELRLVSEQVLFWFSFCLHFFGARLLGAYRFMVRES